MDCISHARVRRDDATHLGEQDIYNRGDNVWPTETVKEASFLRKKDEKRLSISCTMEAHGLN